jgi:hypothetical protein
MLESPRPTEPEDSDEVYVYVKEKVLWPEGNGGRGMWLTPGSAHPMKADDAEAFMRAHLGASEHPETSFEHHKKIRASPAAARATEEA